MAKKWMSKYSQQLFLLAVLFIIFAVLAGKSEYFMGEWEFGRLSSRVLRQGA